MNICMKNKMNREILFRGKNKIGKWVYGSLVHEKKQKYLPEKFFIFVPNYTGLQAVEVDPATVGQYIGIKDYEGKRIFEGGVVKAWIYSDEKPSILEVRADHGCFVMDYEDSESDFIPVGWFAGSVEVIGNIHDNPELLE